MATRSSRCSRSYQRLKSASSAGSISIDVSNMPFPASGIFDVLGSWRSRARCDVRDRLHHRVPDAGIVQHVAGLLDDADFRLAPARGERMRGRGRAEQVVAPLHDDAGNAREFCGLVEKLIRLHEAVIDEIMRFHE